MVRLLKADLYRLFKSKSLYICTVISIAFGVLEVILNHYAYYDNSQFTMYSYMMPKLSGVWMIGNFESNVTLFSLICISIFISSEFSLQTIKNIVSRGFSREAIYISKYISSCVASVLIFCLTFLSSVILSTIMWGFGTIPNKFAINVLSMLGLRLLVILSITSVFVMIAFLIRNTGGVISFNIMIYLLSQTIIDLVSVLLARAIKKEINIQKYFLFDYESIFSNLNFEKEVVIRGVIVCVCFLVGTFLIGMISFKKRDIN